MTTSRWPVLAALAVAASTLLAACGSATAAAPPSNAASSVASLPTQDVVSSIKADPALGAELPEAVRTRHTLTLGTPVTVGTQGLPHGGIAPDGKEVGLDIDLRNAVGRVLGVDWTIQNGTFATIIPGVQNGKYDVGQANFGLTKAREQVVDFATYLTDGQSFLGPRDGALSKVSGLADLCGHTVATTPGSTFQQILTTGAGQCAAAGKKPYSVQLFADSGPIFLGLANGKVDVYFGPTLSLKYDENHVANTRYLGEFSTTPVGFVTAKGSPVAKAISDAVNELIRTGDYARILAKWGLSGSGVTRSAVNPVATL